MQALDERRTASAQTEREAAIRRPLKTRRGHRDRRRRATPDREHPRPESDSRSRSGDLGEQHDRVVGPSLGGSETRVAAPLGLHGQPDRRVGIGLERGDAGADARTGIWPPGGRLGHFRWTHRRTPSTAAWLGVERSGHASAATVSDSRRSAARLRVCLRSQEERGRGPRKPGAHNPDCGGGPGGDGVGGSSSAPSPGCTACDDSGPAGNAAPSCTSPSCTRLRRHLPAPRTSAGRPVRQTLRVGGPLAGRNHLGGC